MAENNNEKDLLYWINRIGTFATPLVTIVGVFVSNQNNAKKIAYIIAGVLALISLITWLYKRHLDKKKAVTRGGSGTGDPTSLIRGLLAFVEGDVLYGRDTEIRDIYTRIRSGNFKFGVLWGESGSGKTSIIGAGVVPQLKKENYLPRVIDKPTSTPHKRIEAEIAKICDVAAEEWDTNPERVVALFRQKSADKYIFFIDQFEEYFLLNPQKEEIEVFKKWIALYFHRLGISIIVAIRTDFFARLQYLAPEIEDPTSNRRTYELENFKVRQATGILRSANNTENMQLTEELISEVISDLNNNGFIRPPELQLVADYLKKKGIDQLNGYIAAGRASGILSVYIKQEIERTQSKEITSIILRLMCAEDFISKSPSDISLATIRDNVRTLENNQQPIDTVVKNTLDKLEAARIIVRKDDDDYNLAHDYLAPLIRNATQGFETKSEWANRTIRAKTSAYLADSNTRLGIGSIIKLQRYADKDLMRQKATRELLNKSKRKIGVTLSLVVIPFLVIFIFLGNWHYMGVARDKFIIDDMSPKVVLKEGHSSFKIWPFNNTIEETWFDLNDLTDNEGFKTDVSAEAINGYKNIIKDSLKAWVWPILSHLSEDSKIAYFRLLGMQDSIFITKNYSRRKFISIFYPPSVSLPPDYIDSLVAGINDTTIERTIYPANSIKLTKIKQLYTLCLYDTAYCKYVAKNLLSILSLENNLYSRNLLAPLAYVRPQLFSSDSSFKLTMNILNRENNNYQPDGITNNIYYLNIMHSLILSASNYMTPSKVINLLKSIRLTRFENNYLAIEHLSSWVRSDKKYLNDEIMNNLMHTMSQSPSAFNDLGPSFLVLLKYNRNIKQNYIDNFKKISVVRPVEVALLLSAINGRCCSYDSLISMLLSKDLDVRWKIVAYDQLLTTQHAALPKRLLTPNKIYALLNNLSYVNQDLAKKLVINTLMQGKPISDPILDTIFRKPEVNDLFGRSPSHFAALAAYNPSWILKNDSLFIARSYSRAVVSGNVNAASIMTIGKCSFLCDTSEKNKEALLKDLFCLGSRRKRLEAMGGLFEYCLQKPGNIPVLKKTLERYKKSIEPTHRISASMLWEMIDLQQRVNEKRLTKGVENTLMFMYYINTNYDGIITNEWHMEYAIDELSEKLREGTIDY